MLQSIGPIEWIVIGLVVVLLVGGKKIPELFKGLGEGIREFRKAATDTDEKEEEKEKEA